MSWNTVRPGMSVFSENTGPYGVISGSGFLYISVEFNEKSQNLLNLKLKQKIAKFAKFVTAFNPGHK